MTLFFNTPFSIFSIRFSTLDHKIKSEGKWILPTKTHFRPQNRGLKHRNKSKLLLGFFCSPFSTKTEKASYNCNIYIVELIGQFVRIYNLTLWTPLTLILFCAFEIYSYCKRFANIYNLKTHKTLKTINKLHKLLHLVLWNSAKFSWKSLTSHLVCAKYHLKLRVNRLNVESKYHWDMK